NQLVNYTHPFDEAHSYTYDVYYDALNRPAIGAKIGAILSGPNPLLRYQLGGYAWAKPYLQNASFFANFNAGYYPQAIATPSLRSNESALIAIAAQAQSSVEGQQFQTWISQQQVLNTNPPVGDFLYHRINQWTIDLFNRPSTPAGTPAPEVPYSGTTIQWSL